MNIHNHWSCNDVLNPATGDEDTVAPLPINRRQLDGCHVTSSFYKPTPDELMWLQAGGVVMLSVLSSSHAPVRVDVVSGDRFLDADIAFLLNAHKAGAFQQATIGSLADERIRAAVDRVFGSTGGAACLTHARQRAASSAGQR